MECTGHFSVSIHAAFMHAPFYGASSRIHYGHISRSGSNEMLQPQRRIQKSSVLGDSHVWMVSMSFFGDTASLSGLLMTGSRRRHIANAIWISSVAQAMNSVDITAFRKV